MHITLSRLLNKTMLYINFLVVIARSNFIGTKFTVFEGNLMPQTRSSKMVKSRSSNLMKVSPRAPSGSYPVAHISYELNVLGSR